MSWAAALNITSGLAFAALALFLALADRRRRPPLLLAALLGLWGVQIIAANAPAIVGSRTPAVLAVGVTIGASLPLPLFLARFATALSPRTGLGLRAATVGAALGLAVAVVALAVSPTWVLEEVRPREGGGYTQVYGPGYALLSSIPFFAVLLVALVALEPARQDPVRGSARRTLALSWSALALYAGYVFPENLAFFTVDIAAGETAVFSWIVLWIGAAGTAAVAILGARAVRRARATLDPVQRRTEAWLAASLFVPAAVALLGVVPYALGGSEIELLGLFRLVAVGLLFYGILKSRLFGLDLTVRKAAPVLGIALAPFVVVPLVLALQADLPDAATSLPILIALAVAAPLPFLAHRTARSLLPDAEPTQEYLRTRRLEVYRAAIETGHSNPRALADRLGLPDDERLAVERVVAASTPGAPPARAPGDILLDTYEVLEVLHEGPNGPTLRCRDVLLDRVVVAKPLGPLDTAAMSDATLREARVAASLDHPRLVRVHKVERARDTTWLVMEHAAGGTLEERLGRGRRVAPEDAVRIATQLLEALDVLHVAGVVHRDVAPQNVFFDAAGAVKLGDFGLARMASGAESSVVGTPGTVSPEVARGEPATFASDLYSVAALTYRMLTGSDCVPIEGRPLRDALRMVSDTPPMLPVKTLPKGLNDWLARGLSKRPRDRFPSARQMREALVAARSKAKAPTAA